MHACVHSPRRSPTVTIVLGIVAVGSLFATVAALMVIGGAVFAVLLFGAFLFALVGLLAGSANRTVRQHNPRLDGKRWRDGA
jgi:hypothetical protein